MYKGAVRNKRWLCVALSLLFLALVSAGCRSAPAVAKIGLVAPFEGRQRLVGYDAVYAARLAVREANARAAAQSWRVELVALDDSGNVELARQAAAGLVVDPEVVAVMGHWQDATTAAALPIYEDYGLPLIVLGVPPFETMDPGQLPQHFLTAYEAVTPFDEVAGPYAAATYDAFQLLLRALELAETSGQINRESVASSLEGLQYEGLTGPVYAR